MTYKEKLEHPSWQRKRLQILERDDYTCQLCGDKETLLHVHHLKYIGDPIQAPNKHLITYCKHCHYAVEALKDVRQGVVVNKIIKKFRNNDILLSIIMMVEEDKDYSVFFMRYNSGDKSYDSVLCLRLNFLEELLEEKNKIQIQHGK